MRVGFWLKVLHCVMVSTGLVRACDMLQVQFLYFVEVLLCELRIAGCHAAQ
jgi:hypothetical protein